MEKPIIFFDGECPLCHRAVRTILSRDRKKVFLFAPLQGTTAKASIAPLIQKHPSLDTLVLMEKSSPSEPKFFIEGRAILRIFWLLGGIYRGIGWLSFLPSGVFDFFYRWVAKRRYRLFRGAKKLTGEELRGRLLP